MEFSDSKAATVYLGRVKTQVKLDPPRFAFRISWKRDGLES